MVRGKGFQRGLTLSFVLASPKQAYAPDRNERATLKMAGLGEESVSLDLLAEAWEINEELCFQFPKLKKAGGYI